MCLLLFLLIIASAVLLYMLLVPIKCQLSQYDNFDQPVPSQEQLYNDIISKSIAFSLGQQRKLLIHGDRVYVQCEPVKNNDIYNLICNRIKSVNINHEQTLIACQQNVEYQIFDLGYHKCASFSIESLSDLQSSTQLNTYYDLSNALILKTMDKEKYQFQSGLLMKKTTDDQLRDIQKICCRLYMIMYEVKYYFEFSILQGSDPEQYFLCVYPGSIEPINEKYDRTFGQQEKDANLSTLIFRLLFCSSHFNKNYLGTVIQTAETMTNQAREQPISVDKYMRDIHDSVKCTKKMDIQAWSIDKITPARLDYDLEHTYKINQKPKPTRSGYTVPQRPALEIVSI